MEFVTIGKTQKPVGLSGAIRLYIQDEYLSELEEREVLFLKTGSQPLPFFIDQLDLGEMISVKFEDIDSREAAKKISAKDILLRKSDLKLSDEDRFAVINADSVLIYKYLEGYQLIDTNHGALGTIEEVLEFPQQEMAVITYKEKETLIPLNETFIINIEKDTKQITLALPDGLIDL